MNIIFSEYAKQELEDAVISYEFKYLGLGKKFKKEVHRAVLKIIAYPQAWPKISGDIRKYSLYKFPYKILYSIEEEHIFIIVVAHQHRKPGYWVE